MEHLVGDISELRKDVRRLDDRVFNLTLASLATLATVLATVIANALS
jgi:hypothetical protein